MNPEIQTTEVKRIDPEWWKYIPFGSNTFELKKRQEVLPYGCQCEDGTWEGYDKVPTVCESFNSDLLGYCKTCGHGEDCHTPKSNLKCKCLPDTWGGEPLPICNNFIPDEEGYCVNCEHSEACHIEEGTVDELDFLKSENARLKADIERVTGKPNINLLIPEILSSLMARNISGTMALKLSVLPKDLQATYYGYLRLTWQLKSQIEDYEDKMSQLKKLLVSF